MVVGWRQRLDVVFDSQLDGDGVAGAMKMRRDEKEKEKRKVKSGGSKRLFVCCYCQAHTPYHNQGFSLISLLFPFVPFS